MKKLNTKHLGKLIEFVESLPDNAEPRDWTWANCFEGMANELTNHRYGIGEYLNLDYDPTFALIYMRDEDSGISRIKDFALLTAAKQKVVLLDVLRTLLKEGVVNWTKAFTLVTDGAAV